MSFPATPKDKGDLPNAAHGRLANIVELAAPVILQMDTDGRVRFASGYYLGTLGLSPETIVGNTFADFISDDADTLAILQQVLAGEFATAELPLGAYTFELRLTPLVSGDGQIVGATAVFTDITHLANTAAELQRSEASFRVLTESSPDAVFVHRFGRIVYANDATRRLLRRRSTEELLGTPVLELFNKDDRTQIAERITNASPTNESQLDRFKLTREDGNIGTFEVTTMAVQYDGDSAVVHIARDVTQTLRMQNSLAKTERLASLGTLAGGVGHEINNPLAYMTANLSFIAEELADRLPPGDSEENLDIHNALLDVRDGTDRVRDIVRQLNEFNRVDASSETLIDPRVAVEAAIRMSWNHLRRRARIETQLSTVGSARGNHARLGQVLLALLLNASQAFGELSLQQCLLSLRCFDRGDKVIIEVSDNGPGIPSTILGNIFDPFYSSNPEGQGTGLGLAVAHSIVAEMGGNIEVESAMGTGTCFRISIPRAERRSTQPPQEKVILVITDEVRFLESVQIALRGQTIRIAGRMSAVTSDLESNNYDAIICDLSSADVDIETFALSARKCTEVLIFVAQSGTTITMIEASMASVLLRKPVGADTLEMQLQELWV